MRKKIMGLTFLKIVGVMKILNNEGKIIIGVTKKKKKTNINIIRCYSNKKIK